MGLIARGERGNGVEINRRMQHGGFKKKATERKN